MKKTNFEMRLDFAEIMTEMRSEQSGQLIKAIFKYVRTGEIENFDDAEVRIAFKFIKLDLDEQMKKDQ